jgi:hypothetical protein
LRHEFSHYKLPTLFSQELIKGDTEPGIEVYIDDEDDEMTEIRRGPLFIYSTLELRISDGDTVAIQRLTADEARCLALKLQQFADFVSSFNREIEVPLGEDLA